MADPTSLHREGAADRQNPTRTPARKPALLHEPFVSPEFGASAGLKRRPSRLNNGVVDGNDRGARALANLHGTGNTRPQAAPLYTVSAAGAEDTGGGLVAPLSVLSNSLLPGKRLAVTDAGCLSVASASATPLSPVAGMDGVHYNLKPDEVPPPQASRNQVEAKGALKPPLNSPRDLSPLVIEAACTWGQALGTILGQDVLHSGKAKPRTEMLPLAVRPTLTTTGLFPQIMTLRFSSSVRVSSVHLRASSVLHLIVQPGEGLLGDGRVDCKKTVTVPAVERLGWSRDEESGQDIDVDVRDVPSFENTRSLTVIITAGRKNFCSIQRIYALGVREQNEQA